MAGWRGVGVRVARWGGGGKEGVSGCVSGRDAVSWVGGVGDWI
jgi:hypothetical protein